MPVAVVLNDEKQVAQILPWATRFARASQTDLLAIVVKRSRGTAKWSEIDWANTTGPTETAIHSQLESLGLKLELLKEEDDDSPTTDETPEPISDSPNSLVPFRARRFESLDPVTSLSEAIATMKIDLLIIPKSIDGRSQQSGEDWHEKLYRRAPCRTMFLHDDQIRPTDKLRVLVIARNETDDQAALLTGYELVKDVDGELTAMFFEPAIADWATQVGDRILERIVSNELGRNGKDVRRETLLADNVAAGIAKLPPDRYDLILIGSRQRRETDRAMNAVPGIENSDAPAIAVVRNRVPLTNRVVQRMQNVIQNYVPQLTREDRISLFERVQISSQWNFDFIALTCLSTMIAALGLLDNSIPVVIGAMLVAPLMTPIIAIGLGLAQGNLFLIKSSFRTVSWGFATAFLIGVITGLCAFTFANDPQPTAEMSSRNMPGFVDLMVALVSGIAAAYALGRPNLSSAIPGVAIAAALVPPLATSGLSFALGAWRLAIGSTLLFLTNMVAIVLAGSIVFWLIGVHPVSGDEQLPRWTRWLMLALIILTLLLTAVLEAYHVLGWWNPQ